MTPKIKSSLALAILGLTLSGVGSASATTFTDSFDAGANYNDINTGQATSRQSGGPTGGVSYTESALTASGTYDHLTQLGNGGPTGGTANLLLAAAPVGLPFNLVYASPNINLLPTPLVGFATVSVGVDPLSSGSTSAAGDWAAVVFGASEQGKYVNLSSGIGFLLQHNGGFQAFDGGTLIANTTYTPVVNLSTGGEAYQNVSATLTNTLGGATVIISVNGIPITFGGPSTTFASGTTYTRGSGFTSNLVTLEAVTSGGNNLSFFNNLAISNDVSAAPEPSQIAGLGFAGFGLLGLLLKARRGRVTAK